MYFTAIALALTVPAPDPAGFRIEMDVNRGVDVALFIDGKLVKADTLYRVDGLPGKVTLKGKAVFFDHDTRRELPFEVELTPGYITTITIKIRANPALVLLC